MAGGLSGFDADAFRDAIHQVMTLAAPPDADAQATFFFPTAVALGSTLDEEGVPFDPAVNRAVTPPRSVKVPCSVRYHDGLGKVENFGILVPGRVVLTLLDVDYVQVKGFDFVVIGGQRYWYVDTEPPSGLGTVGIWKLHCRSDDEG